jgi:carbon monoxide dehydrogenase subunit G
MELTHRFTVPTGIDETWAHFEDVASVAECFPGAQVTSADADSFAGSVKVRLGPIAMVYNGTGRFVDKDETTKRFLVEAKGKDKRGNGTAGATVTLTMSDAEGGTDVEVLTDLSITGKPAQFGRGVMQDVSDKLLAQFVACLEQRLGRPGEGPVAEPASSSGVAPAETVPSVGETAAPSAQPVATTPPAAQPTGPPPRGPSPEEGGDALDLGATVVPVLVRGYWRQGLVAVAVLLLLRRLLRR